MIVLLYSMKGRKTKVVQDPEELRKKVGAKLKRLRKEMGYQNSDDFAYDNNINRSQYGKYESGSQDIRLSTLAKIINTFGLTVEEFFGEGLD